LAEGRSIAFSAHDLGVSVRTMVRRRREAIERLTAIRRRYDAQA